MSIRFHLVGVIVSLCSLLISPRLTATELQQWLIKSIENAAANVSYFHIEWDPLTDAALQKCRPTKAVGKTRPSNPKRASFELQCHDGSQYRFSAVLDGTAQVLVASKLIQRKEALGERNVTMDTLPLAEIRGETMGQPIQDGQYMAGRNYALGQAINPRYIDINPLIKKGMKVKSVARIGTLEIQVEVQALEEGGAGEMIKVQNIASKATFYAKVVSHSVVIKQ